MKRGFCYGCGKPTRLGIAFSPLKTRIIDAVDRAGPDGISAFELNRIIFPNRRNVGEACIRAHVFQINQALKGTGYRIKGHGGFRLELAKEAAE